MKLLVLSTSPESQATKYFTSAGKERGHEMEVLNPEQMYLYLSNVHRKDRLYFEDRRIYKNEIDAVIPRIGASPSHAWAVINHIRQNMGLFSTQTVAGIMNASDKLRTTQLLSIKGIKTPRTVYAKESRNVKLLIDLVGGLPVIVKGLRGSQGANVVILETVLSANSVLESYYKNKQQVLIQEYIEPDKSGAKDIRAIVVGDKVVASMQRTAPKGSFKSNVSLGATAEPIELTDDQKEICINAAEAIGLDVAGVDLMTDQDGNNYVIEINSNFGMHIQDICQDVNIAEEVIIYCEENYKKPDNRDLITNSYYQSTPVEPRPKSEIEQIEIRLAMFNFSRNEEFHKHPEEREFRFKNMMDGLYNEYGRDRTDEVLNLLYR